MKLTNNYHCKGLVLIVVLLLGFTACNQSADLDNVINKIGNTSENIMNRGYVAKQGDWLFYFYQSPCAYKNGLFKSTIDGKHRKRIDRGSISNINVVGNWIYYVKSEKNMAYPDNNIIINSLYKIKTNGSQQTKLLDDCGFVTITGNQIYYCTDTAIELYDKANIAYPLKDDLGNIYRADIKCPNNRVLVKKNAFRYVINGNYLYYFNISNNINRLDFATGTEEENLFNASDIFIVDDLIYFINNTSDRYSINCYNQTKMTTKEIHLAVNQVDQIVICDNNIIYKDVYRNVIDFDKFNAKKISNVGTADYIYAFDDMVVLWEYGKIPVII